MKRNPQTFCMPRRVTSDRTIRYSSGKVRTCQVEDPERYPPIDITNNSDGGPAKERPKIPTVQQTADTPGRDASVQNVSRPWDRLWELLDKLSPVDSEVLRVKDGESAARDSGVAMPCDSDSDSDSDSDYDPEEDAEEDVDLEDVDGETEDVQALGDIEMEPSEVEDMVQLKANMARCLLRAEGREKSLQSYVKATQEKHKRLKKSLKTARAEHLYTSKILADIIQKTVAQTELDAATAEVARLKQELVKSEGRWKNAAVEALELRAQVAALKNENAMLYAQNTELRARALAKAHSSAEVALKVEDC